MGISEETFERHLLTRFPDCVEKQTWALALSGGVDSMALAFLLSRFAQKHGRIIFSITFDHGLREGSDIEAQNVGAHISGLNNFHHDILTWQGDKPNSRIMEEARNARYEAIARYCADKNIDVLFVGHHMDDQAETVLTRLAKGTGLDGLAGMRERQMYSCDNLQIELLRPLLEFSKDDLIATCNDNGISYVDDPSNTNEKFLRPRLRAARAVLEEEGLTAKRLSMTARRVQSARNALEEITHKIFNEALQDVSDGNFVFNYAIVKQWPEEIGLRLLMLAMDKVNADDSNGYGPRLEKVESLYGATQIENAILKRTLGGCIITYDAQAEILKIEKE